MVNFNHDCLSIYYMALETIYEKWNKTKLIQEELFNHNEYPSDNDTEIQDFFEEEKNCSNWTLQT